jgi:hypothetical protein
MSSHWQVIHLHREAPAKPEFGAPCNGCGVCCASEPCPLGMVLSGRRSGACAALRWNDSQARYLCGALVAPRDVLPRRLAMFAPLLSKLAARWISAGSGCDASLAASAEARRDCAP